MAALLIASLTASLAWASATVGASATDAGSQQLPAPGDQLRIVSVDTSAFPVVTAVVALPARASQQGDVSSDFSVASSSVPVLATVHPVPSGTQRVVVLIDTASQTDQATFEAELGGAAELIRQLDPGTPVTVGTSDGQLSAEQLDTPGALAALAALKPAGTRNWTTSLTAALPALKPTARTTVVVLSAGPSDSTAPASPQLLDELQNGVLTVRWLNLTADAQPSGELAGIQSISTAGTDGLLVRLDSIAADLSSQYELSFTVDPRATAATITLGIAGQTWAVQTPLPLPGPTYVPPSTQPQVASEAPVPPTSAQRTRDVAIPGTVLAPHAPFQAQRRFANANAGLLLATLGSAVTLLLLLSLVKIRAPRNPSTRRATVPQPELSGSQAPEPVMPAAEPRRFNPSPAVAGIRK